VRLLSIHVSLGSQLRAYLCHSVKMESNKVANVECQIRYPKLSKSAPLCCQFLAAKPTLKFSSSLNVFANGTSILIFLFWTFFVVS
jgi:hypothetical protein